ncbi:nucleotidyltransferase family protein [Acidomonas methanolica]|uniref:MobA-like NTP transferase domain-containing protein n=1 Tax=Acidomonas methanolica NBRC 104435 TaxID=1231351 RepID=A0A023D456_ACIMT|nr:nucleotidyltransferase family protein [Acidomonas methanolica]MBU2654513.1 nucleotidyltransferase family protein [Acidomonas methanolica]TCS28316.1 GTP:adenosylcobinamide-phosphate guanylyltransferase [Acidomonas methanolica]GAJ28550.1 hypothetical protein Amme_031_012 [Acidomonas methanolica NBRC 104435]GBQ51352.1 hypothetical protein AA0498_1452 [Acidomonas methanolica]GEK99033.1 hypothetical protein AME01nite_15320 [Acidomonas methanolica NBRC 104435]
MTELPVLVLAGSRDGDRDPLARHGGVAHKALLPVAGRPMLARVLDCLRATPGLGTIHVSTEAPDDLREVAGNVVFLPAAPGPSASVAQAIAACGTPLLVTTADHPLLRPVWIAEFLAESDACDLAVAVATRAVIERDVPGTKRTYIRLRDMRFSGCNLFLFATPASRDVVRLWQRLERERKKPWRMAAILGPTILLRAVTGTLTSTALCRHIERLTGARVRLVPMSDGKAAVDVDKPADLTLVERILSET